MVRGAASTLLLALACCLVRASVLVPTYVLPPDSFLREQRSLGNLPDTYPAESQRTIKRLMGGHIKIKSEKEYGDAKNALVFDDKTEKGKFATVITPELSGSTVGWNQGIWDDGMLMSSAGEGKDAAKTKEVDEEKKTLSDQVAEGKYGLIQNEIFEKNPKRPGIISYEPNTETRSKDNLQTLGGLKKDEVWLAEDHLLVIKGGSFSEHTKETDSNPWPPIDNYEAPKRQVKLPGKPKIPPPFPVRLSDNGPLVFLTPNGSIPAAFFPPFPKGESESSLPTPPFPYEPGTFYSPGQNSGNSTSGGASLPIPPFPFLQGNASEGEFPFPSPINGSFPEGFPPGAPFLPPPSNQSDLYDEDDPSIYYPPPYNFSYHVENNSFVPAGPLVPGIILPPPPDFFGPLEDNTTEKIKPSTNRTKSYGRLRTTTRRPTPTQSYRNKYKTRPPSTDASRTTEIPTTISDVPVEILTTTNVRKPQRIEQIPSRMPSEIKDLPEASPKVEKPVYKTRTKLTSKPLTVSVVYDYEEPIYNTKASKPQEKPYIIYNRPENAPNVINDNTVSTPVPLRAYYSNIQNEIPTTKLQPVYNKQNDAVTSFYFYDEQSKTSPSPATYYDDRNYYKTVNRAPVQEANRQPKYNPTVEVSYGSIDQADALFLWPQKQGPRTLTQEYFSIEKPRAPVYVQQPNPFYQQIADIQQTIEFYTTKRPKPQSMRQNVHRPKAITSRPIYQFSYQSKPQSDQLSFRAPKLDPEPFRPMVSYSKPFNQDNGFNILAASESPSYHQQYLIENVQVTTENPISVAHYPKTKQKDDYTASKKSVKQQQNYNLIPVQNDKPAHVNRVPGTTPNPIENGYYTKQDERYFDEITKNSFDVFGKKIEDSKYDINGLAVTPSLGTVKTPIDNNINIQYDYDIVEPQSPKPLNSDIYVNERGPRPTINPDSEFIFRQENVNADLVQSAKPPSLAHDTLVNDRLPRPPINPDSEFIPIPNPGHRTGQRYRVQNQIPEFEGEQFDLNKPSLGGDTLVNYVRPPPTIDPDAEWITPVNTAGEGRPGSLVSYRLPGEDAHVYFLTPQAAQAQAARERYRSAGYGR